MHAINHAADRLKKAAEKRGEPSGGKWAVISNQMAL